MKLKNQEFTRNLKYSNLKEFIDFSSNDYLCLSKNQEALEFGFNYAEKFGSGLGNSRLIGDNTCYEEFESWFSKLKGKESCLIFPSGWQTNVSILPIILNNFEGELEIFSDRLNHNSIQIGIQLSKKKQTRYKNNDLDQLESLLKKSNARNKIVITESVFSMDGTILDLKNLLYLKEKYNFFLYIDDAHSFGIFGESLLGITEGFEDKIDILVGTFSKAVGCQGGYVLSSDYIRKLIINSSNGFIYSTGLSPFLVGFAYFSIKNIFPSIRNEVRDMLELSNYARSILSSLDQVKIIGNSQVIPIILNSEEEIRLKKEKLLENKINIPAIFYPTVPILEPRLRMSLNIKHTKKDINKVYELLK